MIKSLNTFTRLHSELHDRLIKFMKRCPLLDGIVLHKKALSMARSFGYESYVGSFAGLWALLSKTSIKFSRVMGTLPDNYSSYYDDEEEEEEVGGAHLQIPDDSVDIIEILPYNTQEYVMEMVPTDNMIEEIVFLDDHTFHNSVADQEDGRGTKRSIDEDGWYTTTIKRSRIDGNGFEEFHV